MWLDDDTPDFDYDKLWKLTEKFVYVAAPKTVLKPSIAVESLNIVLLADFVFKYSIRPSYTEMTNRFWSLATYSGYITNRQTSTHHRNLDYGHLRCFLPGIAERHDTLLGTTNRQAAYWRTFKCMTTSMCIND